MQIMAAWLANQPNKTDYIDRYVTHNHMDQQTKTKNSDSYKTAITNMNTTVKIV